MASVKISIIIPSFNQANYLGQTIESVVNQQYDNLELIVIDGLSSDNSIEVIKRYGPYITYWTSEKDSGQSEAINKGLRRATGDIISWLNSDDLYEPDTLKKVAAIFNNPAINAICGDCYFFYENDDTKNYLNRHGRITFDRTIQYWKTNPPAIPPQPSVFLRKSVWENVGFLNESLRYGMDYEFWLRVLNKYKIEYVPELLSKYRFHESSKSHSENGFEKFHKEWHQIFVDQLSKKGFFTRLKYNLEYGLFYYNWKFSKKQLLIKYLVSGPFYESKY